MLSLMFWNLRGRDLRRLVAFAAAEHAISIVMLAESGVKDPDMAAELTAVTGVPFFAISPESDKVRIFSRLAKSRWVRKQGGLTNGRVGIWSLRLAKSPRLIVGAAHLIAANNEEEAGQALLIPDIASAIEKAEGSIGSERTVLMGDFNMNPFEAGMTAARAFHAVMTRRIAERESRTVQGRECRFFYNPMWGLFGDRTPGPPGTYFHENLSSTDQFWHMLDQVLVRPTLIEALSEVRILDTIHSEGRSIPLVSAATGRPLGADISDHLPILCRLKIE